MSIGSDQVWPLSCEIVTWLGRSAWGAPHALGAWEGKLRWTHPGDAAATEGARRATAVGALGMDERLGVQVPYGACRRQP